MDALHSAADSRRRSDRWYQWSLLELVLLTVIVSECLSLWQTDKHLDAEDLADQAFWEGLAAQHIAMHDGVASGEPPRHVAGFPPRPSDVGVELAVAATEPLDASEDP